AAEAKLKAAEAEQQRLREEIQRQTKAALDAEAKRKDAEAEQQRLREEEQRQTKAAADAEAQRGSASPQTAPTATETRTRLSKLTKADITKLFIPFDMAWEKVRSDYVEKPDDTKLLSTAIDAMQKALPPTQGIPIAGKSPELTSNATIAGSLAK